MKHIYGFMGVLRHTGLRCYIPVIAESIRDAVQAAQTVADEVEPDGEPIDLKEDKDERE